MWYDQLLGVTPIEEDDTMDIEVLSAGPDIQDEDLSTPEGDCYDN